MRLGAFQKLLLTWAGRPCALTMHVLWGTGPLTVTGILHRAGDGRAERWSLTPPDEFGGVSCFQITLLELDDKSVRRVIAADDPDDAPRLQYWSHPEVIFELALLPDDGEDQAQPA